MGTKKNVLLIPETMLPPVSRANLRLFKLGQKLLKEGYSVTMLTPSLLPHQIVTTSYEGINVYQFPGFYKMMYSQIRFPVRLYHLLATVVFGILLVRRQRIDIIHSWHPIAGFAAIIIGRITNTPVFSDFTDLYSDLAKYDFPFLVPFFSLMENKIWENAKKIVVVSDEMKRVIIENGVPSEKLTVVPDGTDANMFHPEVDGSTIRIKYELENCKVCIYHGDIKYFDGVDLLLKAFSKVVKEVPNARLLIMGGGGKYFDSKIFPMIGQLELNKHVILTGWIEHSEIPKYIAASDIGLLPSRETMNNNIFYSFRLFEYWGIGKPVVASRLKTISQVVRNGENGILVKPENIEDLSEAIIYLLSNPEKTKMMGLNGRKIVEMGFNWEKLMSKEVEIYKDLNTSL